MIQYKCDMCGKVFKWNQKGAEFKINPLGYLENEDSLHLCIDCRCKVVKFIYEQKQQNIP